MAKSLDIIYEDNHLLVINKSAGVVSQGALPHQTSLSELVRQYLKHKYQKPGNVFLGIVSRLDSLVTGVIVLAKTSKAASRLNEQFRSRRVQKTYWAIVEGRPPERRGRLINWLSKNDRAHRVDVVDRTGNRRPRGQRAELNYKVLGQTGDQTLLEIRLLTGRKHQIRVQMAHAGCPIVGDKKYGATRAAPAGIALHSRRLEIVHPTLKQTMSFEAPPPTWWNLRLFGLSSE